MSDELRELYQELILDHNQHPRNFGRLDPHDRHVTGHNPLCGDEIHLTLVLDGDRVKDLRFAGKGCAISKASASLMTAAVKGRTLAEIDALGEAFRRLVTEDAPPGGVELGKLEALAGVREFPMRVKCATLPWHALKAALHGEGDEVSTE